jgi:hypothetical protein
VKFSFTLLKRRNSLKPDQYRYLILLAGMLLGSVFLMDNFYQEKKSANLVNQIASDWYQHALDAERQTDGYYGPVAARMYAYISLAAYQAALPLLSEKASVSRWHTELKLPVADSVRSYFLPAVLHACYSSLMERFFMKSPYAVEAGRRDLQSKWNERLQQLADPELFRTSYDYGRQVAFAVYDWSATDTIGHQAEFFNYDRHYQIPDGMGTWQPCPDFPMPPLLPHGGSARTFYICPEDFPAKPLPPYRTDPGSVYYEQALEIYSLSAPLSAANQRIAEFWSDDHHGVTFSPAGRWISITNQVLMSENPAPEQVLETWLKVTTSLNDAIVVAWNAKYQYLLERPQTFIRKVFDQGWEPLHHTPSHPSYPSGHATIGMAAAEVLTQSFGPDYAFTDRSHAGRHEFDGSPRHYRSFYEMARENALSRILLGVHFRMDGEEGLRLGKKVAEKICSTPPNRDFLADPAILSYH